MAKNFRNREPEDWRAVLAGLGFKYSANDGDDQVWKHENNPRIIVLVPCKNNKEVIISTAYSMIRAIELVGFSRKEIKKWWKDNGYGE